MGNDPPVYMRNSIVPGCAVDDVKMTPALLQVLVALGSYASQRNDQWVWPSQATIARRMGISRQAVGQMVRELAALGYVEIAPQYRDDGGRTTNSVRLVLDFSLPDERLRSIAPRKKSGRGGRPRVSESLPPETTEVSYPPETLEVSGDETLEVSGDETLEVSGDETSLSFTMKIEEEEKNLSQKMKGARARLPSNQKMQLAETTRESDTPPPPPLPSLAAIWRTASRSLHRGLSERGALSASEWDNWIAPIRLCGYDDETGLTIFTLTAPGSYAAEMLTTRYRDALIYALAKAAHVQPGQVGLQIVATSKLKRA